MFEKVSTQSSLCLIFFPSVFQMEVQMEIRLPLLWFCGSVKHDLRHEFFSSASLSHICLCAYTAYIHNTSNAFHIFICSFDVLFFGSETEKNFSEFHEMVSFAFCFTTEV